ncbi:MAG: hypothetical protein LBJ41_03345 [Treponema sp.]|jgi:hypothetical protein|nr:hypothetical protein [Treponema sp.]
MKTKLLLLFTVFIVMLWVSACGSSPAPASPAPAPTRPTPAPTPPPVSPAPTPTPVPATPALPQRDLTKPVMTIPTVKPEWVDHDLSTPEERFFTGKSPQKYATEQEAENAAQQDAFIHVMSFCGELLQSQSFEKPIAGLADILSRDAEIAGYVRSVISQTVTDKQYTEIYRNEKNQEEYVVYLFYAFSRREATENLRYFTDKLSRSYTDRLIPQDNLRDALLMYDSILAELENNPLHRALAYYERPEEKTALYQYLSAEISRMVNGLAFDPVPLTTIQKTDVLETSVTVSSKIIASIGAVNTMIRMYQADNAEPLETYQVPATFHNRFPLNIPTQVLTPGQYTVRYELLLKEIANQSKQINKNINGEFLFVVSPVNVVIGFTGEDLINAEKNILEERLAEALKDNAVPVQVVPEPQEVQNQYSVMVMVNTGILPPLPPVNTQESAFWDISLAFLKNGAVIQETERNRVTLSRTNSDKVFSYVVNYVRDNKSFFQDINATVSR